MDALGVRVPWWPVALLAVAILMTVAVPPVENRVDAAVVQPVYATRAAAARSKAIAAMADAARLQEDLRDMDRRIDDVVSYACRIGTIRS